MMCLLNRPSTIILRSVIISIVCSKALSCELDIVNIAPFSGKPYSGEDTPSQQRRVVNVQLAKNEYEAASVVVRNRGSETCHNISLDITAFKSKGDKTNGSPIDTDLKIVKRWLQEGGGWKTEKRKGDPVYIPELLLNDDSLVVTDLSEGMNYLKVKNLFGEYEYKNISIRSRKRGRIVHERSALNVRDQDDLQPFNIGPNHYKQIWLTFRATNDALSGPYSANIEAKKDREQLGSMKVDLELLPFNLRPPNIVYSIFYRGKLVEGEGSVSSEYKNIKQYENELVNMREHGICCPTSYQSIDGREVFEKSMMLRKKVFGSHREEFMVGLSASTAIGQKARRYMANVIGFLNDKKDDFGVSNYYLFGRDEAKGKDLTKQKPSWDFVKRNNVKVFTTGYKKSTDSVIDSALDVFVSFGNPDRGNIKSLNDAGKKLYTYAHPQSGPEDPLVFRHNYGLALWQKNVEGTMPYAYHASFRSVWNDFDHQVYRDHNFTYPTVDGVIDTIAWEGFREGVDDVRYAATLESRIERFSKNKVCTSDVSCRAIIKLANTHLQYHKNAPLMNLDAFRKKTARLIMLFDRFGDGSAV